MAEPTPTGTTQRPRETWIDLARGACVLLVVLYHVVLWHLQQVDTPPLRSGTWVGLNDVAGGIRMPLLLMLSGLLAAGKIGRGRSAVRGAAANYWLYAVWLTVYAVAWSLFVFPTPEKVTLGSSWATQLLLPGTPLWYVFALSCYLLFLWLARPLPGWLVIALLAVPMLFLHPGQRMWMKVPVLAIYFAIGVYASGWLKRTLRSRAWALVLAGVIGYLVSGRMVGLAGGRWELLQASFFVGNLGKGLTALGLAWYASRLGAAARLGAWVGRHTLAIYVMHPLLLGALMLATSHSPALAGLPARLGGAAVGYPLLVTALIAAMALALEVALKKLGVHFLFGLPGAWDRRLRGWERGPVAPRRAEPRLDPVS
ncbi:MULTISPECIES: acyltransferase family protein [unclassified Luteococcus]|uniref:acyltransferase family protein n=1 Tax=unclassified Luteococcus TaxID=2639923 RepID=UPI00313AD8D8